MARTVKTSEFSAASARYVDAAVKKANTNANAFLTKAEAAALPADLKDNYQRFRLDDPRGIASAKLFAKGYAEHVRAAAERADVNGDGVIAATEARYLPKDLQDNFANYARVAPLPAPKVVTEVSLPLSQKNIDLVRAAMTDFVEHQLTLRRPTDDGFEYENRDWAELVHEFGGDDEHAALKAEALDLAKRWTPDSDWDPDTSSRGGVYFVGHFKMITMFISLDQGKPPSFATEID